MSRRRKNRGPSPQQILDGRTPKAKQPDVGAWSAATLASWGVPWPPCKGWRTRLERQWAAAHRLDYELVRAAEQRPGPPPRTIYEIAAHDTDRQESPRTG